MMNTESILTMVRSSIRPRRQLLVIARALLIAVGLVVALWPSLASVSGPTCQAVAESGFLEWLSEYWLPTLDVRITEVEVNSCADDRCASTEDWVRVANFSGVPVGIGGWFIRSYSSTEAPRGGIEASTPAAPGQVLEPGEAFVFRRAAFWLEQLTVYKLEIIAAPTVCGIQMQDCVIDTAIVAGGFVDDQRDAGTWVRESQGGWAFVDAAAECPVVLLSNMRASANPDLCEIPLHELQSGAVIAWLSQETESDQPPAIWAIQAAEEASGWSLTLLDSDGVAVAGPVDATFSLQSGDWCGVQYCPCRIDLLADRFEHQGSSALRSSAVHNAWYDAEGEYLLLQLDGGKIYHYCNVSPETWHEFLSSSSRGSYYNAVFRGSPIHDCRQWPVPLYASPQAAATYQGQQLFVTVTWGQASLSGAFEWSEVPICF